MTNNNDDNKQYTGADIQRYLNKEMSVQEMHELEKAALEDPFLADAIEGFTERMDQLKGNTADDLEELHHRLQKRIDPNRKTVSLYPAKSWRVAAVILLLAGTGVFVYTLVNMQGSRKSTIVKNEAAEPKPYLPDSPLTETVPSVDSTAIAKSFKSVPALPPVESPADRKQAVPGASAKDVPLAASSPVSGKAEQEQVYDTLAAKAESARDIAAAQSRSAPLNKRASAPETNVSVTARKEGLDKQFSGKVVDLENKPVAGASIFVANSELSVLTDSGGYFSFSLPDSAATVAINSAGFEPTSAVLRSSLTDNRVILKENRQTMSEVAVKAKTVEQKSAGQIKGANAEPVVGWSEYEKYLEQNNRIRPEQNALHGAVEVSFFVDTNGKLSGFEIAKSLSTSLDQEAIRLVKEGPPWKVSNEKRTKASVIVRF